MSFLELKILPVAVALLAAALVFIADRAAPALSSASTWRAPVALLLLGAGLAVAIAGVIAFRRAQTTVDPLRPERASTLVTDGVYRRTRNPMYLGLALCIAAYAAWVGNLAGALALPFFVLYMTRFQIVPEERALSAKFGPAFRAYCGEVRRWI